MYAYIYIYKTDNNTNTNDVTAHHNILSYSLRFTLRGTPDAVVRTISDT